jgi:hypothetical protein
MTWMARIRKMARATSPCLLWGGRHGLVARATLVLCVLAGWIGAQTSPADTSPRFAYVDVLLDTHAKPLAAYQFEFTGGEGCQTVGIEGGEHPAFANPPYYDPAAMEHDRVIVAAYSTAAELPAGKMRISRLHLRVTGKPTFTIRLMTAGSTDGKPMAADISIREGDVK